MNAPATIQIDPITVEVIGSALQSIVEEMGEALVRASYSTNIKERRDCSTALFDHRGNTLCQAEHIPMHLGSFLGVIPAILNRFSMQDIRPGDVFMANDAYAGGATHLPDIVLAEPIFVGGTLIAWAVNTAHHSDFADRGHDHIYQEGLRIPPVRLYREGILNTDLQEMFLLNCQVPRERISDLRAQMSANRLCVQRMTDLCNKYGKDKVLAAGDALQDYAERKMRAAIAAIPDGEYSFEDQFDSNQRKDVMTFKVTVTVSGDEMTLDFDGPPQVRGGLNLIYTSLLAASYFAVKSVLDPTVLPNAGLARPLTVTAPKGSILNCEHPAAVDGRIAAAQRVTDLVFGALAKALPGRVMAAGNGCCTGAIFNGTDANGNIWVYLETIGGGGGARPSADGLSGIHVGLTNTSNLPVEALELEYPLTLLRYELVDDSAGLGEFRGGMGIRRVYRAEKPCRFTVEGSRVASHPWGLDGGQQADCTHLDFGDGRAEFSGMIDLKPGQIVSITTPGGGGYGDPAKRKPEAVARDLAEGRISARLVRDTFGLDAEPRKHGATHHATTRQTGGWKAHFFLSSCDRTAKGNAMVKITKVKSGSIFEEKESYSRIVAVDNWIFVSNTAGRNYKTREMSTDAVEQAKQCFRNIEGALKSVGSCLEDVVQSRIFIPYVEDAKGVMEYVGERLRGIDPQRTVTCSPLGAPDFKVEIEVTAYRGASKAEVEQITISLD